MFCLFAVFFPDRKTNLPCLSLSFQSASCCSSNSPMSLKPLFSHRLIGRSVLGVYELFLHLHWPSRAEVCIYNFLICKCAARNSNKICLGAPRVCFQHLRCKCTKTSQQADAFHSQLLTLCARCSQLFFFVSSCVIRYPSPLLPPHLHTLLVFVSLGIH